MSDWKYHINNKFSSCRHVANARDPHRGREVKLFHMPGNFEYVGMFDGIDAMICPIISDPYSVGIARLFNDIREGKTIEVKPLGRARNRVELQMELLPTGGLMYNDPPGSEPERRAVFPRARVKIMTESPPCATHATQSKKERTRV